MGNWEDRGRAGDYLRPQSVHCTTCGKMIPRRAWVVTEQGKELLFCSTHCERIYREYWLPRYGTKSR